MKKYLPILFAFAMLTGCNDAGPADLAACNDSNYTRGERFEDVETIVKAMSFKNDKDSTFTSYFILNPDAPDFSIPWVPCNLPEEFKKDNLAIKISGTRLKLIGGENYNTLGLAIELARIKKR